LILHPESGSVVCSSAGHCKPIIVRDKTGFVEEFTFEVGIPLGLFEPTGDEYQDQTIQLMPCDGIFLYTDGLSDLVDENRARYGIENLKKSLERSLQEGSKKLVFNVLEDMNRFRSQTPLEDDVTIVYMKAERTIQ
jgi:sigma-B regulation protein RsbU (phosphoserine phosphatase)